MNMAIWLEAKAHIERNFISEVIAKISLLSLLLSFDIGIYYFIVVRGMFMREICVRNCDCLFKAIVCIIKLKIIEFCNKLPLE